MNLNEDEVLGVAVINIFIMIFNIVSLTVATNIFIIKKEKKKTLYTLHRHQ